MIDKEKLEDAYKKRDCFFKAIENGDLDKVKSMLPYVKKVLKSGEMDGDVMILVFRMRT